MTLEEAGIWLIPRHALEIILFAHPHTAFQIMENMADRFIDLTVLTADLSLRTGEGRLAKFLIEQAKDDVIFCQRWIMHREMAKRLGAVLDVLSRIFREFARSG